MVQIRAARETVTQDCGTRARFVWYLSTIPFRIGGIMRNALRWIQVLVAAAVVSACAAGTQSDSTRPSGSRNVITREQLDELPPASSAMDAVRRLRSTWLRPRGSGGLGASQAVLVFVDNVHAGGLEFLESRPLDGIMEIRYYDARDATTKWGTGVSGGVIEIITVRE